MSVQFKSQLISKNTTAIKNTIVSGYNSLLRDLTVIKSQQLKVITLTQADFKYGTVIISEDGYVHSTSSAVIKTTLDTTGYVFKLGEDIKFDPTNTDPNNVTAANVAVIGKPSFSHGFGSLYPFDKFGVGFFAAISIDAENIVIDLNGHTLEQSNSHALTQRFYANIETANSPFLPHQGPHSFGSTFKPASRLMICNGTLGRSAHHGIHGNNQSHLIVKDVEFVNYEVSMSSLNGGSHMYFVNCIGRGSNQNIPTLGVFFIGDVY